MTRPQVVLVLSAILAAVGCASFKPHSAEDYDRLQAPQQQFAADAATCAKQAEADQQRFGMEFDPTQATFNRMFDACMRASGYRAKEKK